MTTRLTKPNLVLKGKHVRVELSSDDEEEDVSDEDSTHGQFSEDLALFVKKYGGGMFKKNEKFTEDKVRTCYNCEIRPVTLLMVVPMRRDRTSQDFLKKDKKLPNSRRRMGRNSLLNFPATPTPKMLWVLTV